MSLHFGENNAFHFTHFRGSVADSLYKFHFRASLSLYYRSPDGATTERTERCYKVCANSYRKLNV